MLRIYVKNPSVPVEMHTGLELTFDDIANVPVADASSISDWNTFFDLPTNGTPFTSVEVVGDMVRLIGGGNIVLVGIFNAFNYLYMIHDTNMVIVEIDENGLENCNNLNYLYTPAVTTIGINALNSLNQVSEFYFPLLVNLGPTVADNDVFADISGQTITLTIPSALMTCNGGAPDGDIAYLQSNNTVTIVTV